MARIRTIKPEFWTNEKVMSCSPLTRLFFVGMWNFADDYGRLLFAPIGLKAKIFPNDSFTAADIRDMLDELCRNDLLVIYSANDKEYIEITGWDHQKIDKRQVSKIPGPFVDGSTIIESNSTTPADSRRLSPTPAPVMEGNGMEGSSEAKASGAEAPIIESLEAKVYRVGKDTLGKSSGGVITKLRKHCGQDLQAVCDLLEQAKARGDPMEWIQGILRHSETMPVSAKQLFPDEIYQNVL